MCGMIIPMGSNRSQQLCQALWIVLIAVCCGPSSCRSDDTHTICENLAASTVRILSGNDRCSGVMVTESGVILTVAHGLASDSKHVTVVFFDGSQSAAVVSSRDSDLDLAVLQLASTEARGRQARIWSYLPVSGSFPVLRNGDPVFASGYPGREANGMSPVVRSGTILALQSSAIRTTCPLTAGDSGGPLVDETGRLIGLHRQIGANTDMNLHIPMTLACGSAAVSAVRGAAGVSLRPELRAETPAPGAAVLATSKMSTAIIETIDRVPFRIPGTVLKGRYVAAKLSDIPAEQTLRCRFDNGHTTAARIIRSERDLDIAILQLANPPAVTGPESATAGAAGPVRRFDRVFASWSPGSVSAAGLIVRDVHQEPAVAARVGGKLAIDGEAGLLIEEVFPNGALSLAQLKAGDRILTVNSESVRTLAGLGALLKQLQPGDRIELQYLRDGVQQNGSGLLQEDPSERFEKTEFLDGRSGLLSRRRTGFSNVLQIDLLLEPQQCGGPLISSRGEMLGVVIARRARESTLAIPVAQVLQLLP